MISFFALYWKYLAALAIAALVLSYAYNKVYTIGYKDAESHYVAEIEKLNSQAAIKIDAIVAKSDLLVNMLVVNRDLVKADLDSILLKVKGVQVYNIDKTNNICTPTDDFVNTYNSLIDRANTK